MKTQNMTLTVTLTTDQAWAMAQFCKRVGFETIDNHSTSSAETENMQAALCEVRKELNRMSYDPR